MKPVAVALSLAIVLIGAIGVVSPPALLALAAPLLAPGSLWIVAAIRIAFGALLVGVASRTRMPRTLRVVGIAIVLAGLLTPLAGVERLRAIVAWWSGEPSWLMRAWAALGVAFGAFVLHALGPPRRPRDPGAAA